MQLTVYPNYYSKAPNYKQMRSRSYADNLKQIESNHYKAQINFTSIRSDYDYNLKRKLSKMNWFRRNIFGGRTKAKKETTIEFFEAQMRVVEQAKKDLILRGNWARTKEDENRVKEQGLIKKENELRAKNSELSSKECQIKLNEKKIIARENELTLEKGILLEKSNQVYDKEHNLIMRENKLQKTENELISRENGVIAKTHANITQENKLKEKENELLSKEGALNTKNIELDSRENAVMKEETLQIKKAKQIKAEGIQKLEEAIEIKEKAILTKRDAIRLKEEALNLEEDSFLKRSISGSYKLNEEKAKALKEKEAFFDEYIADAKNRESLLNQQLAGLNERDATIAKLKKELEELATIKKGFGVVGSNPVKADKGWARIAGHETIKEKLDQFFTRKLSAEQSGVKISMPNGILIFGPKGSGKQTLAEALAEQSQCNFVNMNFSKSSNKTFEDIISAAKKSKELYKNSADKKRTILLLDNFYPITTNFKEKDGLFVPKMKNFLQKCSDEFKCTVIMTSNEEVNHNSILLADQRIQLKVFLGPPNEYNTKEIFKFYLKDSVDQSMDYDKLATEVMQARKSGHAYSSGKIQQIVKKCKLWANGCHQKLISPKDLLNEIKTSGPDISEAQMEQFGRDILGNVKKII